MEADGLRKVRSVEKYLYLFPPPTGNDIVVKKSANVSDTVQFIRKKAPQTNWQTKKFAKFIRGKTLDETCSNIWHWLYEHIPYKKDEEGVEQVRSPRRLVYQGSKTGVDCDCFSFTISSVLLAMEPPIPHKYRITKYPKTDQEPRWQHIYIVVPKNGKLDEELRNRNDYIVIDCVKDRYDDEEPYLEFKDYDAIMRLDYLDGLDGEETYKIPASVDQETLAAIEEDDLGKLRIGQFIKKTVKKVADTAGKGIRFINKVANPVTVALRNAFLLAMKINFMNIARRLRYGYMSDQEAAAKGVNLSALSAIRKIREKAETIYWQAGGNRDNLKLAILKGKGNKDGQVTIAGLDGLGEVYEDPEEYRIMHSGLGELGIAPLAAITAALPVLTILAKSLKSVKDLFKPGSKEAKNMDSDSDAEDTATSDNTTPAETPSTDNNSTSQDTLPAQDMPPANNTAPQTLFKKPIFNLPVKTPVASPAPVPVVQDNSTDTTIQTSDTSASINVPATTSTNTSGSTDSQTKAEFFKEPVKWIKENPGKTVIIGAGILVAGIGTYLIIKHKKQQPTPQPQASINGLEGMPTKKRRRRKKAKKVKSKTAVRKSTKKAEIIII